MRQLETEGGMKSGWGSFRRCCGGFEDMVLSERGCVLFIGDQCFIHP
jgi:hypothetical protein